MYLYHKKILEYAQIAESEPKSMIFSIEGHSNTYTEEAPLTPITETSDIQCFTNMSRNKSGFPNDF